MSRSPPRSATQTEPFLVLPENQVAHAAMTELGAALLREEPEPLVFLHGPAGVGKSHLVRLGKAAFQKRFPDSKSEVLTASEFAAQVAEASSGQTLPLFQAATRDYDLLIVEDLQTLEGRSETLVQLLHLVNTLSQNGSAIVCTASRPPGSLAGFPPRLISRLRGGLTIRVRNPGLGSRVELMEFLARRSRLKVASGAWSEYAAIVPANPREMQGMLFRLSSMARQHGRIIDAELIRRYHAREEELPELKLVDVCRGVAQEFGVKSTELRSEGRARQFAVPRQVGMWLSRQLLGASLKEVGEFYGGRDHTTVVHACRRIGERVESDALLQAQVERIRQYLRATD